MTANGNNSDNPNRIIFINKDTYLFVAVVSLSAKYYQILSELLSKRFERWVYWNEYKRKSKNKNTRNDFVGVNKLFVLVYLNRNSDVKKYSVQSYYWLKSTIKNYNVIINGKNIYDQSIDFDIKSYEEIRNLITRQGVNYTTGCLFNYGYIKVSCDGIAVDLKRQK